METKSYKNVIKAIEACMKHLTYHESISVLGILNDRLPRVKRDTLNGVQSCNNQYPQDLKSRMQNPETSGRNERHYSICTTSFSPQYSDDTIQYFEDDHNHKMAQNMCSQNAETPANLIKVSIFFESAPRMKQHPHHGCCDGF